MLLVTAVSVTLTSGVLQEKAHYQIGADKEFVMSDDQNFVILLLDTVDARTFSKLLEDHPEYNKDFQDFTYFENTVGAYSCTKRSIPFILSGDWYENDEPFDDYMRNMYEVSPLFNALQEKGYNIFATKGTAQFLETNGVHATVLHWPDQSEQPNTLTYIKEKKIDLVVNIPKNLSKTELNNDYTIRRSAIDFNIPLITNARLASAFITAFCKLDKQDIKIKSWNEY